MIAMHKDLTHYPQNILYHRPNQSANFTVCTNKVLPTRAKIKSSTRNSITLSGNILHTVSDYLFPATITRGDLTGDQLLNHPGHKVLPTIVGNSDSKTL